jgi:DNA topoisomerase-2
MKHKETMTKSIEQKYQKLSDVEHCLIRPGRYIGSVEPHTAQTWLVGTDSKMYRREATWNPGLLKLFDEVISNSVDHSKRPEGKNLDTIKVDIDRASGEITVLDNGGIPVVLHADYNEYVPELIFGYLRSGSNFDDTEDSTGTGQNGEGASLTNIFSTKFTVETSDGKNSFKHTWTNNMTDKSTPKVWEGGKGFTRISFIPDYAHLKTTLDDDNYAKMVKRVYDIAGCNPKLKVFLNGERIIIKSFKDYIALYTEKFEFDDNGDWQIGVAASDDGFSHVSFVNTTETSEGGTHLYYIWYQIATKLREYIQKKHKIDVKQTEIQSHMQVFINARIVRPRYNSQTKEYMITEVKDYKTSWEATEKFIKRVVDSGIVDRVLLWAEAKAKAEELKRLRELNKNIDKGVNFNRIDKFTDAMEDRERHLCELYLTEGDSARKSIQEARGKNPYIGSFALKGKPLNVMDVDMFKILGGKKNGAEADGNSEIQNILKITGLKIGVPVKSVKDLRFGKIVFLSDQDLDGFHVSSLLINFFSYFWPELFEMGVIYRMNTPLVIATVKGVEHEFLTDESYEEWAKTAPRHDSSRFKGLGKFKTDRFSKILENRCKYLVRINKLENEDLSRINLAFKGNMADSRKEWLNGVNYFASID